MAFPQRLLGTDEKLHWDSHPFWGKLAAPVVLSVVLVAGALLVVFFALPKNASVWWAAVLAAPVVVCAIWLVARWVEWVTTSFTVTSRRVVERTGILGRSMRDIPLRRIQSISVRQRFFERFVGAGSVIVESAGAGAGGTEVFSAVAHAHDVHSLIGELMQGIDEGRPGV